jgi:hypothetical protein
MDPGYQAISFNSSDAQGLGMGILIRFPRVALVGVSELGEDETFLDPVSGTLAPLFDAAPALFRANIQTPNGGGLNISLLVTNIQSINGIDHPQEGPRIRARRQAQAEFISGEVQGLQSNDAEENIIVAGGFNAFQFNDGFVDVVGALRGTPALANTVVLPNSDMVNPDLINLIDLAQAEEKYSSISSGNAAAIDHLLVTSNLLGRVSSFQIAKSNADFPEIYRNDPTRPERASDHDIPLG